MKGYAKILSILLIMILVSCSQTKPGNDEMISKEAGIAYMNLETGEILAYNGNMLFHAASTMKTPVMFQLYYMRDLGVISMDDEIFVGNNFTSIVDGSIFSIPMSSEQDEILYPFLDTRLSYYELIDRMITHSSNLATNILMEYASADSIAKTLQKIEANGVLVLRGVEDLKAYELGLNNVTTALGMMKVMEAVYRSDLVSDSSRAEMMEILHRQHYNGMIPQGLPDGMKIAHKTGSITRIAHDAAIVLPEDSPPFILVILTRGWDNRSEAQAVGAKITSKVYDYHLGKLKRTDIVVPDLLK